MRSIYLLLLATLCGCSGYQYVASPHYVPLNTEKGHLKANLSHNHAQAGYSVGNHIALFSTAYWRRSESFPFASTGKQYSDNHTYDDNAYEINGGASYFMTHKQFVYELHLGGGGGKISYSSHDEDKYYIEMDAHRANLFLQPSFGYRTGNMEVGGFSRFIGYRYHNLRVTGSLPERMDTYDRYFTNRDARNIYFAEPGAFIRLGGPWLKFHALASFPISLQSENVRYRSGNLYMGFFLNLDILKNRR